MAEQPEKISRAMPGWPKWMRDIAQLLPVRSQFVLSGNTRDSVAFSLPDKNVVISLNNALKHLLDTLDYDIVLAWDMVDGLTVLAQQEDERSSIFRFLQLSEENLPSVGLPELAQLIRRVASPSATEARTAALIVDFTSRLPDNGQFIREVKDLYVAAEKAAIEAASLRHGDDANIVSLFNPVFWVANRPGDVPYWFPVDNHRVQSLSIPEPDLDARSSVLQWLASMTYPGLKEQGLRNFSKQAAMQTHGMTINALKDIMALAEDMGLPSDRIDEAVESYRVGDLRVDNPWRSDGLRNQIARGMEIMRRDVKGQEHALRQALNVLKRSWLGLTGAQASSSGGRPKGILFFVGPTGVGKTQLAKAITKLLFGDESAYKRFDMSEFSAEHSAARMIGAPPGYTGFNQGGELTNAMRENPFRVLLFDEIEKAHDGILDKFLQILEDGRLTDGSGQTVYFSDALIIFTSNKGVFDKRKDGSVDWLVSPDDDRKIYVPNVMKGVKNYFYTELGRPELFNRVGENFVVFDFIGQEVSTDILEGMLNNIGARLAEEHELTLEYSQAARESLARLSTRDLMDGGGRGIGSKLEQALVNPLAEHVFDSQPNKGSTIFIKEIIQEEGAFRLDCENRS